MILESELLELKAHYEGQAQGVVIESELDKFRGAVATLLVQNGTLKVGDMVLFAVQLLERLRVLLALMEVN